VYCVSDNPINATSVPKIIDTKIAALKIALI